MILFTGLRSDDLTQQALERDVFDVVVRREGTGSRDRLCRRMESALARVETRRQATREVTASSNDF